MYYDRIRVLYVGDDDTAELKSNLEREIGSLTAFTATDPDEGLEVLESKDIDCVLFDDSFSGIDVTDFLERVRRDHPDLPFILFTEGIQDDILNEVLDDEMADFLEKRNSEVVHRSLAKRIEGLIAQRKSVDGLKRPGEVFHTLVKTVSDVIITIDTDSTVRFVNDAVEEVFGYEKDEVIGESLTMLMPGEMREKHIRGVERYLETGEKNIDWSYVEFPGLHKDGHKLSLAVSFADFSFGDERFFTGVVRDISERKRKERDLRETKEKIEALHDVATELEKLKTEEEVYRLTAEAARNILEFDGCVVAIEEEGYLRVKETSGKLPPEIPDEMPVDRGIAGKTYRNKDSYVFGELANEELVTDGVPYGSVISVPIGEKGVFQALSEKPHSFDEEDLRLSNLLIAHIAGALSRIDRERMLREERDKFEVIFDNIPDPALSVVYKEGETIVEEVNSAFEETFGYTSNEIVDEGLDKFLKLTDDEREIYDINRRVRSGKEIREEVRRRTVDGMRDFILHVVPQNTTDEIRAYAIYTDITDRKQRERKIEVLNRVLRHDLRNDANVILGNAELLLSEVSDEWVEERLELIVNKALEITEMSEKSRKVQDTISTGGIEYEDIDIVEVIEDRLEIIRRDYPGVEVDTTVPEEMWVHTSELIDSAVDNILENAIEHNDKENPKISISVSDEDGEVEVIIADNGPGIPHEEIEVLEKGEETDLEHVSGLGLWLINWIVEDSGGRVEFSENEPEGSVVSVRLPSSV
ncbi:MAG: PAS domain S-box protein [Halobacteria archaeon]|nr:PAS domain S-box protein [Halobacteria archaeon]